MATLLELPKEIHELICGFLVCDACSDLDKQHVANIGLTCHQLREAAVPVYFKHVSLKLRSTQYALLEPTLFRLRRERPQFMRHVRCVHIETVFDKFERDYAEHKPFIVPVEIHSMLGPRDSPNRKRVEAAAHAVFDSADVREANDEPLGHLAFLKYQHFYSGFHIPMPTTSLIASPAPELLPPPGMEPEEIQKLERIKGYRNFRYQLDALTVVTLCLPPALKSIVFKSVPNSSDDCLQNEFALHVMAATIDIFGDRIVTLSLSTSPADETSNWKALMHPMICTQLKVLRSLTLDAGCRTHWHDHVLIALSGWHALAPGIKHLTLRDMALSPHLAVPFISGFTEATTLQLDNIGLAVDVASVTEWLVFLIEIRSAMPDLVIELRSMRSCEAETLTRSAVHWLMNSAIPVGIVLEDPELKTQLLHDFMDYLPFWEADDGERGEQAREARKDGKLVDQALSSRFRGGE